MRVVPVGQIEALGWLTTKIANGTRTIREVEIANENSSSGSIMGMRSQSRSSSSHHCSSSASGFASTSRFAPPSMPSSRKHAQPNLSSGSRAARRAVSARGPGNASGQVTPPARRSQTTGMTGAAVAAAARARGKTNAGGDAKAETPKQPWTKEGGPKKASLASTRAAEEVAYEFLAQRNAANSIYLSSESLKETAAILQTEAEALEAASANPGKKLAARIGRILAERKMSVADLLRAWDPNGDGQVSKMELRVDARNLLGQNVDIKEVDALFEELDSDHSGKLDRDELNVALTQLKKEAMGAAKSETTMMAEANAKKERAAQALEVAEATAILEVTADEVNTVKNDDSVGGRIFKTIQKKSLKVADIISKMDESNDGEISMKEFKQGMMAMGAWSSPEEMRQLFKSLDSDGGGTLDVNELKVWLTTMVDEAERNKERVQKLLSRLVQEVRVMKAAQAGWKKLLDDEKEAAAKEAERLKKAEIDQANKRADEDSAKVIAKLERKASKAAEKAAFDERVMAKRLVGGGLENYRQQEGSFGRMQMDPNSS